MKLTIVERLLVLNDLLHKKGDFAALKEVRQAREALSFTGEELEEQQIISVDGKVSWPSASNDYEKDIPLTAWVTNQIQENLRDKNTKGELEEKDFTIYEKFIVAYDQV